MYKKSKDYEKLWRLTNQGEVIAGWAKNNFGNPSKEEVFKANRKIEALYLHKSITEGLLESYK